MGLPSMDYAAVLPIKKRKFPITWPPSSPPGESCPVSEPNEKQQESTSASQVSAVLDMTCEERKPESSAISEGAGASTSGKQESSAISEGAGPTTALQQSEDACVNPDKSEILSARLALTKGGGRFDCSIGTIKSESDDSDLRAIRSNWDLNTTMDTWEDSDSYATSISTDHRQCSITAISTNCDTKSLRTATEIGSDRNDTKPRESRAEMAGDQIDANPRRCPSMTTSDRIDAKPQRSDSEMIDEQIDVKPLRRSMEMTAVNAIVGETSAVRQPREVGASSALCANPQTREDSLQLGLQMPFLPNFSLEPPYISPGIDPNAIFSRVSSAGSSSVIAPLTVKSEPYEETEKQVSLSAGSSDLRSLVGKVVKHEAVNKSGLVISSSLLKLFNPGPETIKNRHEDGCLGTDISMPQHGSESVEKVVGQITEATEASKLDNDENLQAESNELHPSSSVNAEDCATRQEKLDESVCAMKEDSDHVDKLSGNCLSGVDVEKELVDREDIEYEDGEVQDQLLADKPAGSMNATPTQDVGKADSEPKNMEFAGNSSNNSADLSFQSKESADMQLCSEIEDTLLDEKINMSVDLDSHLQDLSDVEVDSDSNRPPTVAQGAEVPPADEGAMTHIDSASICAEATISGHDLAGSLCENVDDSAVKTEKNLSCDDVEKNGSVLSKTETSVNSDAVGRDSNVESNRSRIINLSATFNVSPGKASSASDKSMPLHDGRKRLPDVALEGDKLHLRGRDEVGNADFHRLPRERDRDIFSRSYRPGFARDRGRVPGNMCDDWESEQDFSSEIRNGPVDFRTSRYRYNSEYRNYNVAPEEGFVGTGRGGRKMSTNFHSPHSMRRGHGGRDGPATHVPPMMGRAQRNLSPSRCISMDDSELDGVRHGFVRRDRNMGSFSEKGLHRIHSKSPVRLRSRSPVQWSSPRRRSPGGFVRHPDMAPRRSPPMFRRDRMGSPDRACFRGDVIMRRQNSPPYVSRPLDEMREMNPGRDHGFSRSIMHNGNSSSRLSLRTRRYDMVNSRDRAHGEYFRAPIRGARFHELSGDENTDERRRLNDKRGPVRHFRPCGSENKGFNYSSDDGSRSYRICEEDDSVYHEGRSPRERQLERHPKNEPGEAQKSRKTEDREGSFRRGATYEFDEMPRYKRERF